MTSGSEIRSRLTPFVGRRFSTLRWRGGRSRLRPARFDVRRACRLRKGSNRCSLSRLRKKLTGYCGKANCRSGRSQLAWASAEVRSGRLPMASEDSMGRRLGAKTPRRRIRRSCRNVVLTVATGSTCRAWSVARESIVTCSACNASWRSSAFVRRGASDDADVPREVDIRADRAWHETRSPCDLQRFILAICPLPIAWKTGGRNRDIRGDLSEKPGQLNTLTWPATLDCVSRYVQGGRGFCSRRDRFA